MNSRNSGRMTRAFRTLRVAAVALLMAGGSSLAHAAPFSNLFVFGDSLSDSGNNAVVLGGLGVPPTAVPIAGNAFIPTAPYVSGRYTNGMVWAETFASHLGVSAAPSLLGGSNLAFGGATTGPAGGPVFPASLRDQVGGFLLASGNTAPSNALYVIAGGGNNARAALTAIAGGADAPSTIVSAATAFAADAFAMVSQLVAAGAEDIVVWTAPNVGVTPAVRAMGDPAVAVATALAGAMNGALLAALDPFEEVRTFDLAALIGQIVATPSVFGFDNVSDACAADLTLCDDPSSWLFWDGIHPTSGGHAMLARAMVSLVPEPGSLALIALALGPALLLARRGRGSVRRVCGRDS